MKVSNISMFKFSLQPLNYNSDISAWLKMAGQKYKQWFFY